MGNYIYPCCGKQIQELFYYRITVVGFADSLSQNTPEVIELQKIDLVRKMKKLCCFSAVVHSSIDKGQPSSYNEVIWASNSELLPYT